MVKKPPVNRLKGWIKFTNVALQMGLIIGGGAWLGTWLDTKYSSLAPAFAVVFSLAGVFIALYLVIKQVRNMNRPK